MKDIIRRILKEDVNNTLYDKVTKVMRRPYIDFLRKNGLGDEKSVKEIMERKLGKGDIIYNPYTESSLGGVNYTFKWSKEKEGYYTERKLSNKSPIWSHSVKIIHNLDSHGSWITKIRKYIDSEDIKQYFELTDDLNNIKNEYLTHTNWNEAPTEVKNDKFFSSNY